GETVSDRAPFRADPAAAADSAAEDPAQHRGRGANARPRDRHLGGGAPRAQTHPARTLQPAAYLARHPQAAARVAAPCTGISRTGARRAAPDRPRRTTLHGRSADPEAAAGQRTPPTQADRLQPARQYVADHRHAAVDTGSSTRHLAA